MAASGQPSELPHLVALIKTMTIPQLKDLLRNEGLALSGLKAALQLRIIDYLERLCNSEGNSIRYDAMKRRIQQSGIPGQASFQAHPAGYQFQPPTPSPVPMPSRPPPYGSSMSPHTHTSAHLSFKESPFFTSRKILAGPVECKGQVREQTRDHVDLRVTLDSSTAKELQENPNLRVMVYCAADSGLKSFTASDIAFPHQVELKVNEDDVKANLRGLKNRPGTTQPADITNKLRKKTNYHNHIVMTYALTTKKFFVLVQLVDQHPIEELVAQLKTRKIISKEQVVLEMKSRAQDSDIVATSSIMSLKCPLSTLRIQKQAPTWNCPVCSKSTSFASLQVDQYVDEILRVTSSDVEQVVVQPDGTWSEAERPGGVTPGTDDDGNDDDDNDDLIEINEPVSSAVKREPLPSNIMLERTPTQSRETSAPSSAARTSSKKRSAAQVIDLTASDEEDDEMPVPSPKRPAYSVPLRGNSRDSHQPIAGSPLHLRSYPPSS